MTENRERFLYATSPEVRHSAVLRLDLDSGLFYLQRTMHKAVVHSAEVALLKAPLLVYLPFPRVEATETKFPRAWDIRSETSCFHPPAIVQV